jgi:hypothetical protein
MASPVTVLPSATSVSTTRWFWPGAIVKVPSECQLASLCHWSSATVVLPLS